MSPKDTSVTAGATTRDEPRALATSTAGFRERLQTEVLAIATRILSEEGLAALQARRIAVEAGCSVGTLYNIFGDLDGLILAANAETLILMDADLRASYAATANASLPERLTALALTYMRFAFANRQRWSAIFEHRLPAEKDLPDDYDARRAELLALLSQAIGDDVRGHEIRMRAARALFASVHGIITLSLANKLSPFDAADVEADIRFIVAAAARGLCEAA